MIAVIAAMGGEIERHRNALLPPRPAPFGKTRSIPAPSKTRHIAGSSRAGRHTSLTGHRGQTGPPPARFQDGRCHRYHQQCTRAGYRSLRGSSTSAPRWAGPAIPFPHVRARRLSFPMCHPPLRGRQAVSIATGPEMSVDHQARTASRCPDRTWQSAGTTGRPPGRKAGLRTNDGNLVRTGPRNIYRPVDKIRILLIPRAAGLRFREPRDLYNSLWTAKFQTSWRRP